MFHLLQLRHCLYCLSQHSELHHATFPPNLEHAIQLLVNSNIHAMHLCKSDQKVLHCSKHYLGYLSMVYILIIIDICKIKCKIYLWDLENSLEILEVL